MSHETNKTHSKERTKLMKEKFIHLQLFFYVLEMFFSYSKEQME